MLAGYLPAQLDDGELTRMVAEAIAEQAPLACRAWDRS